MNLFRSGPNYGGVWNLGHLFVFIWASPRCCEGVKKASSDVSESEGCESMHSTITHFLDEMRQAQYLVRQQ